MTRAQDKKTGVFVFGLFVSGFDSPRVLFRRNILYENV